MHLHREEGMLACIAVGMLACMAVGIQACMAQRMAAGMVVCKALEDIQACKAVDTHCRARK